MGHGTEVVDLGRLDIGDDRDQVGGVAKISVMKENLDSGLVSVSVDVVDTSSVKARRTTDNSMDLRREVMVREAIVSFDLQSSMRAVLART